MSIFVRLTGAVAVVMAAAGAAHGQSSTTDQSPKITLYGAVVANGSGADAQLSSSDVPSWAVQSDLRLAPPSIGSQQPGTFLASEPRVFEATARQTRVGLRVEAPAGTSNWTPTGQIEIDFFGDRPATGHGSVFNQPSIRLALISLAHSSGWALVAGQDWAVFAPANPTSFAHYAVPLAASGGNPWMRLPQFRLQKNSKIGGSKAILLQLAAVRPAGGGDAPTPGSVSDPVAFSGERSGLPFFQTRAAFTSVSSGRPNAIGVSAHYGHEKAEPQTLATWGVAVDASVGLGSKAAISGEWWQGENLDTFQAGINQGVTQRVGTFRSIKATGGWAQVSLFATSSVTLNGGYGLDDPDDTALTPLLTRAKNQVIWANLMVKPHANVTFAFEYNRFDTTFRTSAFSPERKGSGNYGNVAVVLSF
jgi:hypothetical protein